MSVAFSQVAPVLSSALVRSVLDSTPDAMIIIDATGTIVFANRQVGVLFGYSSAEIVGQPVEMLMPARFRQGHTLHRMNYASAPRVRPMGSGLELYAQRQDGSEFPVEISLSPIWQEGQTLSAAALRDVSERKAAERALKEARAEADRANIAKSRFLATASHDLRQPLQSLALLNGTLERMLSDADCLEALAQQAHAIDSMSRLLNALLDISKLESGAVKPDISDFEVSSLFDQLRAEFAGLAANKGLQLEVNRVSLSARSDPALVGQVLRNLLTNAIKYTRQGWVRLQCLKSDQGVRIQVLDTGIGIPADQLAFICDEFYQVGVAPNTSRDGYGLGLSIVQRLVKLLDLRMEVRSDVGRGSMFSIELPAGQSRAAPGPAAASMRPPANPAVAGKRILLVEDDVTVRAATRLLLKVEGYHVTPATSLAETREILRTMRDFDAIVTDYHLGDTETGLQVIEAAREALGAAAKAVLVTGDTSATIRTLQHDEQVRVASKPINADELLRLLQTLLAS